MAASSAEIKELFADAPQVVAAMDEAAARIAALEAEVERWRSVAHEECMARVDAEAEVQRPREQNAQLTARVRKVYVAGCTSCGQCHALMCVPWLEGGWIGVCNGIAVFVREEVDDDE